METVNTPVIIKESPQDGGVTINNLQLRLITVNRTPKDIKNWKDSWDYASRIYEPNRSALYDLYDVVSVDTHLSGIIDKRIDFVLNKTLYFEKDGEKQDEFDDLVNSANFRKLIYEILQQKFWGLSGFEFIPGKQFDFNSIPRKHIRPDTKMIIRDQWGDEGISYDGVWNLWVLGDRYDLGLLLKCSPYAIWKKGNMGDWAQYVEIFGQPIIKIIYDGFNTKTRQELDDLAKNMASSSRVILPKEAQMDVLDGKQSNGNGDLQNALRKACNDEMSIRILGNTETTDSSASSGFAQAKVHGKQQLEITKTDMVDVVNAINSDIFLNVLKTFGFNVEGGRFCYKKEFDVYELQARANVDATISKIVPIGDDYFYDTYGIPKPDNYDELRKKMDEKAANPFGMPGQPNEPNNPNDPNKDPNNDPNTPNQSAKNNFWKRFVDFFEKAPR